MRGEVHAATPAISPAKASWWGWALWAIALAISILALSGAAEAHHTNPTCQAGGYTQTWSTPKLISTNTTLIDECILIRTNVTVQAGVEVRALDVDLVFDNNQGNLTLTLEAGSIFDFQDNGDDASRADDGLIRVLNYTVTWSSFLFNASQGVYLYVNDTTIVGGGVPGTGLAWNSGFYVPSPADLAWNNVDHTTFANGLILVGYANTTAITNYTVRGGVFAVYLQDTKNLTFLNYGSEDGAIVGMMANDSENLTLSNFASNATSSAFVANRVSNLLMVDARSARHQSTGIELNAVVNATLKRVRLWHSTAGLGGPFGLEIDDSRGISIEDIELTHHSVADLHIRGSSQLVNVTRLTAQTGQGARGIWIEVTVVPTRLRFDTLAVTSKGGNLAPAVQVQGASDVVFLAATISLNSGTGLSLEDCGDVRFLGGSITLNGGDGAYLRGTDLSIEGTSITSNVGAGLVVGGGSFLVDRVVFAQNGATVRTPGTVAMRGSSTITNSTLAGGSVSPVLPVDAVSIASDGSLSSRLLVFNNSFTSVGVGTVYGNAITLDGIYRADIGNNTFQGLPLSFTRTAVALLAGNTYLTSKMPIGSVVISFDNGTSISVAREAFVGVPSPAGLLAVVRALDVASAVSVVDVRLPLAEFGVLVTAAATGSASFADLRNASLSATRAGAHISGITKIHVEEVSVNSSGDGLWLAGGYTDQDISVVNVSIRSGGQAVRIASDSVGSVSVLNLTLDRSAPPPRGVVDILRGFTVTLYQIDTDGAAYAINVSESRLVFMSHINFTNNTRGFMMSAPSGNSTWLNWSADTPTTVFRSSLRFQGEVTILGQPLSIVASNVSVFATLTEPRASRFVLLGPATLDISGSARVVGEDASAGPRQVHANFTIELSAESRVAISDATLSGLGDPASALPVRQGLLLRADTSIANVRFVYAIRPLQADGINLTVAACYFSGTSAGGAAVTLNAGAALNMSNSVVERLDGVWANASRAWIASSSFNGSGVVLTVIGSQGTLLDSAANDPSLIVHAISGGTAEVWRVSAPHVLVNAFEASSNAGITVHDSSIGGAVLDAKAQGGGVIVFEDTLVARAGPDHPHEYASSTIPDGGFDVYWMACFGVEVLSSGAFVEGAGVSVADAGGAVVFSGATAAGGFTPPVHLLEFASNNGLESYHVPLSFTASFGGIRQSFAVAEVTGACTVVALDDVPPQIRITNPPFDVATSSNTETLIGFAQDDESGLALGFPCVSFNGGNCQYYGTSFVVERTLLEGLNTFEVVARDGFGNEFRILRTVTRDTTPPAFGDCSPGLVYKANISSVLLSCQLDGAPDSAQVSGVQAGPPAIAPDGALTVQVTLAMGPNPFRITVVDKLGNVAAQSFSWTFDVDPPRATGCTPVNDTVPVASQFLRCTIPSDATLVTVNGKAVAVTGGEIRARLDLVEGNNSFTLVAVDDVGNTYTFDFWLEVDTTTNCVILTPMDNPEFTDKERIVVGGRCDPDVVLRISSVPNSVTPDEAGYWSVTVGLTAGANVITIEGLDSHGAQWYTQLSVTYLAGNSSADPTILIIFALLAGVVLAAAFFVSRRPPRSPEEADPPRPATGSQKAPPRPSPTTMKLPETPEDLTYQPRPPPPPSPPPPKV